MHYAPGCVHRRNRMLDRSCTTRQLAHNPQSVTRDPSCARRLGRPMSPEPRGKAASAHAHDVDPALLLLEVGSGVRYGRVAAPGSRPRPGSANVPSRHDAAAPPPPCAVWGSVFYVTWRVAPVRVFPPFKIALLNSETVKIAHRLKKNYSSLKEIFTLYEVNYLDASRTWTTWTILIHTYSYHNLQVDSNWG
jgi:hypothetical protein